jgi:AmiR/NasT family two-component response regulator
VLYDREVLELRGENERLRRELEALEAKLEKKTNLHNATMRLMLLWTGNAEDTHPRLT